MLERSGRPGTGKGEEKERGGIIGDRVGRDQRLLGSHTVARERRSERK